MSATRRIKVHGRYAGYHIVTRTNHREYRLNDHMKRFFVQALQSLNALFEIEIGSWVILDSHFHILCRYRDPRNVDPDSAIYRWNRYHHKKYQKNSSVDKDREYVCNALTDVSFFMKKLNTLLTREYNRMTGHVGTLWERRFQSSIVERGKAMLMTAAYIELNSFRASLAGAPEEYEYSSLWWLKKNNPGDLIATDILDEYFHVSVEQGISDKVKRNISKARNKKTRKLYLKALYEKYLAYVYERGTRAPKRKLIKGKTDSIRITEQMQKRLDEQLGKEAKPELEQGVGFCKRMWNFTRGEFIGSRSFAQSFYGDYVDPGYEEMSRVKRHEEKWLHGMAGGVWGVFNGSRRGREEQKQQEQSNADGENWPSDTEGNGQSGSGNRDDREKWIGDGPGRGGDSRGSPPI